jgi:hypothetical protein
MQEATTMMQVGMLWLDDDPQRPLGAKIERAASYYRTKYGVAPEVCYVHPASFQGTPPCATPRILTATDVLPHHFWLGREAAA